jgi:hypothetical protein
MNTLWWKCEVWGIEKKSAEGNAGGDVGVIVEVDVGTEICNREVGLHAREGVRAADGLHR